MTEEQEMSAEARAELEEATRELNAAVPVPEGKGFGEVEAEDLEDTDDKIRAALSKIQGKMGKAEEQS